MNIDNLDTKKPVIICGPTGSGKTALAIKIAKQFKGELINADSRQMYKYLDIGTNKGPIIVKQGQTTLEDIPIHLVSFLEPSETYDLVQFVTVCEQLIAEIISRGNLPIIVGGTGLYIDALINGYQLTTEKIDQDYRNYLNTLTVNQLQEMIGLNHLSHLNDSDRSNPRRLIRLIEKNRSQLQQTQKAGGKYIYTVINTSQPIAELEPRLIARVEQMWDEGIVDEVKQLLNKGIPADVIMKCGVGYGEVIRFILGEISATECKKLMYLAHRQYAKRQITWLKKYLS